jgi:hypothetical protein
MKWPGLDSGLLRRDKPATNSLSSETIVSPVTVRILGYIYLKFFWIFSTMWPVTGDTRGDKNESF